MPKQLLVTQFAGDWLATRCGPAFKARYHQANLRDLLRLYILPYVGHLRVDRVTPRVGGELQLKLFEKGLAPSTVRYIILGVAGSMWRDALRLGHTAHAPFRGLTWPKPDEQPDPFTEDEAVRIIAFFRDSRNWGGLYWRWVGLLFWTGARPSEIAGLRWGDVNLDQGSATIRRGLVSREVTRGKHRRVIRTISLGEDSVSMLDIVRPRGADPRSPICAMEDGRPIDSRRWSSYRWIHGLRQLGLRHRRMYCARHTYISLALSYGAPALEVAEHCATSLRSIERYYATFIRPRAGDPLAVARKRLNARYEVGER